MSGTSSLKSPLPAGFRGMLAKIVRRRIVLICAVGLGMLIVISTLSLGHGRYWYDLQSLDEAVRHRPSFQPVVSVQRYTKALPAEASGLLAMWAGPAHRASSWLGHDDLGRSLFYRLLPGYLVSLWIGLSAAGMSLIVGTLWGAMAGLAGGRVDAAMMRIVDVLFGLPYLLMVILLKVALAVPLRNLLGGSRAADIVLLILAIGGVSWLTMARVIRGQVLALRTQQFIEASRAAGGSILHVLRWHVLPNLVGPMLVYAALVIPQAILQESFLSFLGVGIQQPIPSLGRLAADGVEAVNTFVGFWWLIVFPCVALVVTLLALNFIADGLRDALDPQSESQVR